MKAAALVVLATGWLAGCSVMPIPRGEATLYVVQRSWHTDIGMSVEAVTGPLASLRGEFPGVRYMVFGFGERTYYMAQAAGSGEMLAALLPSKSAILMTALNAPPTEAFADHTVIVLRIPQSGVDRIVNELWNELENSPNGGALRLGDGPYPGSTFYASAPIYDLFNTCNTWTAHLLRIGGVPVNPNAVLFADQVIGQVTWIASMQR